MGFDEMVEQYGTLFRSFSVDIDESVQDRLDGYELAEEVVSNHGDEFAVRELRYSDGFFGNPLQSLAALPRMVSDGGECQVYRLTPWDREQYMMDSPVTVVAQAEEESLRVGVVENGAGHEDLDRAMDVLETIERDVRDRDAGLVEELMHQDAHVAYMHDPEQEYLDVSYDQQP